MNKFTYLTCLIFLLGLVKANGKSLDVVFQKEKWEVLKYSSLEANKVSFGNGKLKISIKNSASPLIYPLVKTFNPKTIFLKGKIKGQLNLKKEKTQGDKGNDDFRVRVGLVYLGDQTLNFFQRQVAPSWVLRLFKLAPKNAGVDHIAFFNSYQDQKLEGKDREHYASELLKERFILKIKSDGTFEQRIKIQDPKETAAIWLSSDGDDTNSSFDVEFEKITLEN